MMKGDLADSLNLFSNHFFLSIVLQILCEDIGVRCIKPHKFYPKSLNIIFKFLNVML